MENKIIRNSFFRFSLLAFLVIAGVCVVAYIFSARQINRSYVRQQLSFVGEALKLNLRSDISSEAELVTILSHSRVTRDYFMNPTDPLLIDVVFDNFDKFQRYCTEGVIYWVNDIDKIVHISDSAPVLVMPKIFDDDLYEKILYQMDNFYLNITYHEDIDLLNLWIHVPVFTINDDGSRTPRGIIGTGLNLVTLTQRIDSLISDLCEYSTFYVFNQLHEITLAKNTDLVKNKVPLTTHLGDAGYEAVRIANMLEGGQGIFYSFESDKYLVDKVSSLRDLNLLICYPALGTLAMEPSMNILFFSMLFFIFSLFVVMNIYFNKSSKENNKQNEELVAMNKKLGMVVKATKIGLWSSDVLRDDDEVVNPDVPFIWSPEFRNMLGYTNEIDFPNVLGSWINRLAEDDRQATLDQLKKHILDKTSESVYDVEYRLLKKNGEYGYFRAYGGTSRDSTGKAIKIAGSLIDITEDKNILVELGKQRDVAENANQLQRDFISKLSKINEISTKLFLSEPDTFEDDLWQSMKILGEAADVERMYIWKNFERDGLLYCFQLYEWYSGVESQEGKDFSMETCYSEVVPEWEDKFLRKESINDLVKNLSENEKRWLEAQGIVSILAVPIYVNDYFWGFAGFDDCKSERCFTQNEETLLRSASLLLINAVTRNEMSQNIRSTTIQLEESLKISENATRAQKDTIEQLNMVVQATGIGLWSSGILEDDFTNPEMYMNWSDEFRAMIGYTDETDFPNTLGSWIDSLLPEDKQRALDHVGSHFLDNTGNTPYDIEYRLLKKNGGYGHFRAYGGTFRDENGKPIKITGSLIDISNYKNLLLNLERQKKIAEESLLMQTDITEKLNILNELSMKLFLSDPDTFEDDLWQSMKMLGDAVNADRVYIWKNIEKEGVLYASQLYEWSEYVDSFMNHPLTIEGCYRDNSPEWEKSFLLRQSVNDLVRNRPAIEREILEPQGNLSFLVVPIYINDYFWGFSGFDDCKNERYFTQNEESLLRSANFLFINAITRNELSKNIRITNTHLSEALAKAENATQTKTKFLAAMSHEIRTPMNAIIGIVQMQLQNVNLPDEYTIALEKIYSSGATLLGIINDILDLSKIETGKMEIVSTEYDIPSLIHDTLQLNMVRIGTKPVELVLSIDENMPLKMIGDELRLKQIMSNLLSNAIKYTEKGYVKLSVGMENRQSDDSVYLRLVVEDTGQGMKSEDCKKLFSAYSRFNIETNKMIEGTGIGLNITKNLLDLMGGTIDVESTYGKGSIFTVLVKQEKVDCPPIGTELAQSLCNFSFSSRKLNANFQIHRENMHYGKVLIVDDVKTNLYVAEGLMSLYNLQIETAVSGFVAIKKVKDGGVYDIIFMDHMMPIMDGIEATQKLREMGYSGVIVALTANALTGHDEMFKQNGFDDFISKPIDVWKLDEIIKKYIKKPDRDLQEPYQIYSPNSADNTEVQSVYENNSLLKVFRQDAEKSVSIMRDTFQKGNIKLFTTVVHGMKATLASIGEHEMSKEAAKLETAGLNDEISYINANAVYFIESLETLLNNIPTSMVHNSDDDHLTEDTLYLREKLLEIKNACENYDDVTAYATLDCLGEHQWKKETQTFIDEIRDLLFLNSDFDCAAKRIEDYLL